jgi:hypothetical protein
VSLLNIIFPSLVLSSVAFAVSISLSSPIVGASTLPAISNFSVADSSAVFAVKIAENDNALAFYPGKFNATDLRMAFQFDSSYVSSDITFDLMQLTKGTSGKDMTYKMIVSLRPPMSGGDYNFVNIGGAVYYAGNTGCDKIDSIAYGDSGPERYVIENIFAAQGGTAEMTAATTIKVADLIKTKNANFSFTDFAKKRIIVAIIGEASEAAPEGTHHPIVAIDDISVSYWIDWHKAINSGLTEYGETPPTSSLVSLSPSITKIIGKAGQLEILDAQAPVTIYTLTGQKTGTLLPGSQSVTLPAGIYLVSEKGQPTRKVIVR